ncbi:MAG: hypothetical protein HY700_03995 [Gemmatimonadetes bacterium]|nr:hypothetical protein [Gemmatimonadota bacterium]
MRSRVEVVLSALALAAFTVLAIAAWMPPAVPHFALAAGHLERVLPEWTARPRAETLHVDLHEQLSPAERDWLAALKWVGSAVTWNGGLPVAAVEAERESGNGGAVLARLVAAAAARVVSRDQLGTIDSLESADPAMELRLPLVVGDLAVEISGVDLRQAPSVSRRRNVVVLATAGWESRFVIAALESEGWQVDARLRVGPGIAVTQGIPLPLDTARHGTVIVEGAVDRQTATAIEALVRSGGGLVLSGSSGGLEDLAPGRPGRAVRPVGGLSIPAARRDLEFRPLARVAADAEALDVTGGGVRAAARRVGAGRVLQIGDEDTWRLAMGSDAGRREHTRLWSRAVAFVRPRDPATPTVGDDVAPRAALVSALGQPGSAGGVRPTAKVPWETLAGGLLFAALIAEWTARRLRGRA